MLPDIYATLYDEKDDLIADAHAYRAGNFHFNWNAWLDISLVLKGAIRLHSEEEVFDVSEDMFAIINPNIGHAAMTQEEDTIVLVLTISETYIRQVCGFLPAFRNTHISETADAGFCQFIRASMAAFFLTMSAAPTDSGTVLFARSQIDLILSALLRHFLPERQAKSNSEKSSLQRKRTRELIRYIDQHFREELTLTDLAEQAGMSASYLSAFFKKNTGLGFHEYLNRKRLAHAIFQLGHSDDPILDIALDSGFSDLRPFYSAFRKYLNLSPGKYREALQARDGSSQIGSSIVLPAETEAVQKKLREYVQQPITFDSVLL